MTTNHPPYEPYQPPQESGGEPTTPVQGGGAHPPVHDYGGTAPVHDYGGTAPVHDYGGYPPPPPAFPPFGGYPPPMPPRRRRGRAFVAGMAAFVAAGVITGVAVAETQSNTTSGSGSSAQAPSTLPNVPMIPGGGLDPGRNGTSSASLATAAQQRGIVTVTSVLRFQGAESAGTGMILTSNGEVLTNNHVIDGATSVTVTVPSTGHSYRANVVGTDPTDDVAVLQLQNASGLTTANVGSSSGVTVGASVVGVGNAGGTGTLRASSGKVTGINQSITASDQTGANGERLTGMIAVNADIISGDSGGPLYNSVGKVIGMDTAASTNGMQTSAFAIPIDKAVNLANQIESGVQTTKIHIGLPSFLGVGVATDGTVTTLLPGGPAASAGITPGSSITAINGKKVINADSLRSSLNQFKPGQRVTVTWSDSAGASHSATVTLGTGPAD
ncbi:MAG TPA: trypsin-like peptidase domain-containing protein [Jatrophihabitans sp.]|nr:trypsin-like peptidase domain-containing protein [Jatrophihabitans sp.]